MFGRGCFCWDNIWCSVIIPLCCCKKGGRKGNVCIQELSFHWKPTTGHWSRQNTPDMKQCNFWLYQVFVRMWWYPPVRRVTKHDLLGQSMAIWAGISIKEQWVKNSVRSTDGGYTVDYKCIKFSEPIREPATMLLLGTGIAGLADSRSEKRINNSFILLPPSGRSIIAPAFFYSS